ncbi:MAG: hypothetical protein ACQUYJ_02060 [Ferruginibacter sp.]
MKRQLMWVRSFFKSTKEVRRKYSNELSKLAAFFLAFMSFVLLIKRFFDIKLLPVVALSLEAFHQFCHAILHFFVFSWVIAAVKIIVYALLWLLSHFTSVLPHWPHISICLLYTDLALVSLALTRIFRSADIVVPRSEREMAEAAMSKQDWKNIEVAEGVFWGSIHRIVEGINKWIWKFINRLHRFISRPIKKYTIISDYIYYFIVTIAASVFMWGFIRLTGYLINIIASRQLQSPIMKTRRKFFRHFLLFFAGALICAIIFAYANGFLFELIDSAK